MLTGTTNTAANTALRYLGQNQSMAASSLAKLSSGSRIVKASDDAASLAVGTRLKADVTALKQAATNAGQASSLLQVADGGMSRIADILQRMKALAVQSQSGSVTDKERGYVNQEYTALSSQIDDIAGQTKFNSSVLLNGTSAQAVKTAATTTVPGGSASAVLTGAAQTGSFSVTYAATAAAAGPPATPASGIFTLTKPDATTETVQVNWDSTQKVFDGSVAFKNAGVSINFSNMDISDSTNKVDFTTSGANSLNFQVGASASDTIAVSIDSVTTTALGINGSSVDTAAGAISAGNNIDNAISSVNNSRAKIGALESRFEYASSNLSTSIENLDAARSTLMDVDMATEMSKFSSAQVLSQASVAMLAQANQMPQGLLRLLQ